jgi:hypothetical protein
MTITTEEAERLATLAEEWDRYELGKKAPEIAWNWERAPVVIRSLAAERDALRAENARLREALRQIELDCDADYPPSHGAIKYAARAALGETQ